MSDAAHLAACPACSVTETAGLVLVVLTVSGIGSLLRIADFIGWIVDRTLLPVEALLGPVDAVTLRLRYSTKGLALGSQAPGLMGYQH